MPGLRNQNAATVFAGTGNWVLGTAMLFRKCGEFLAGLLDFCCWSCSLRPSGRWRWRMVPSREAMHCMRQSVLVMRSPHINAAGDAMPSCDGAVRSRHSAESSETSFQPPITTTAARHHCCCGATTSEWARPAPGLLCFLKSSLIEPARPSAKRGASVQRYFRTQIPPAPRLAASLFRNSDNDNLGDRHVTACVSAPESTRENSVVPPGLDSVSHFPSAEALEKLVASPGLDSRSRTKRHCLRNKAHDSPQAARLRRFVVDDPLPPSPTSTAPSAASCTTRSIAPFKTPW